MNNKRFYKIDEGKKLAGVCGGVAEYFNLDPTIVRVVWLLLALGCGTGLLLYIVCTIVFPHKYEVMM